MAYSQRTKSLWPMAYGKRFGCSGFEHRPSAISHTLFRAILISLALFASFDLHTAAAESAALKSNDSPGLRMLEEMQTVITDLAESAKPSVVNLIPLSGPGRGRELSQERAPNASGSGSGVVIDPDGYIITNNHVIGDATEIEVRFSDKSKLISQVVGKDLDTDIALL